ncbi:MAG TPA: alanine racemase, partial [Steroidobacteraceae bacterium]
MTRLVRAVIDTRALRSNLAVVRRYAPRSRVMAVVKANAYGHGLIPAALSLADADALAVARLEEGIALRNAAVRTPIVLLEGVFDAGQLRAAAHFDFEIVVHSPEQLQLLANAGGVHRFSVWLKVDTGMNRLGFRVEDFPAAYAALRSCPAALPRARFLTHLASADVPDDEATTAQIQLFERTVTGLPAEKSLANSAAILGWPASHGDWVRPGLMLYGISPIPGRTAADFGLLPAMTLYSTVISVRHVLSGEHVGYGGIWTAQRPTTLAIAAVGYGDGYPRHMANGTPVLVNGARAPIAGRVAMDMIGIDVTDLPPVRLGDPVILWGEGLPAELIAPFAETVPYELVCGVSQRVALEVVPGRGFA